MNRRGIQDPAAPAFAACTALWVLLTVQAASAAPAARQNDAVVVSGSDADVTLHSGGSATEFSLRLPEGASCPGDSTDANYRVQSYMVPVEDDPGALRYTSVGPEGKNRFALYDTTTSSFVNILTAQADGPGEPGAVVNIAKFNFAVFEPGQLPPGRYDVGIACSLFNETVRYWNVEMAVVRAVDDEPAQIRWTVAGTNRSEPAVGGMSAPAIAVVVAVGAAAVAFRRIRRPKVSSPALAESLEEP